MPIVHSALKIRESPERHNLFIPTYRRTNDSARPISVILQIEIFSGILIPSYFQIIWTAKLRNNLDIQIKKKNGQPN